MLITSHFTSGPIGPTGSTGSTGLQGPTGAKMGQLVQQERLVQRVQHGLRLVQRAQLAQQSYNWDRCYINLNK